jgi:hypothetical protein
VLEKIQVEKSGLTPVKEVMEKTPLYSDKEIQKPMTIG